ncbi:MAG TPA: hypothetical protein VGL72_18525 [Bryobacteraceae bacterium]|jgi:hypothetical protein
MTTEKQLAANQTNAQASTGPKTESGKRRSALNATRHGLTGQVVVLPHEDREAFQAFSQAILADLDVDSAHEHALADLYIGTLWKLQRAHSLESNLYTLGLVEEVAENLNIENAEAHNAVTYAKAFRNSPDLFSRLALYTQRLVKQSQALLNQLKEVQSERRHREDAELGEAIRAYKFKKMQGEPFDPAQNGFVCSLPKIEFEIARQRLNRAAEIAERCAWDRSKFQKMAA